MAMLTVSNSAIRGIAACVPSTVEKNINLPFYSEEEALSVIKSTGIETRHIADDAITATDLCVKAGEVLLDKLRWDKSEVDLVAFVTQMPDFLNQPNSFVCHEKLGFGPDTMCLDFFQGCPGWVIALSAVSSMIQNGKVKKCLLFAGDTASKIQDANDRESRPLFGDAGVATAIEFDENAAAMFFNIGTDSEGGKAIRQQEGGARSPYTVASLKRILDLRTGNTPKHTSEVMDAMDVFGFAISKVPKSIKKLCSEYEISLDEINNVYLHQANKMIIETIAKRLKVSMERVPLGLKYYGNTTSASIPLTMVSERKDKLSNDYQKNIACGFGTGLSWASVYFETSKVVCPEVIIL